jgi:predicted amidophosphoribosyltransferase
LDDVVTTGTTLDQCAYLLRKGGAEEVAAFSLARQMEPTRESLAR